ncbi:probable inactive purple acid phosphatase 16 isoform X2 [Raphanus sativus]|uniref:Probable inactive purple acid phosphatase 16 isoform X2 n=1 Tax=Raphanus sativus TaxID=3726 RepID=A0A9W3BSK5_RAPSA|nr:probable inactive purple acid phosphatase 16 isoform X2 [Raphanus sativus]
MKTSSSLLIFTVLSLPLISAEEWELSIPSTATAARSSLRVREGSPFKIAIFADLHFGEDTWTDWGPRQDANSVNVMSTVLDAETPANNIAVHNASLFWDKAISPTRDRNIPWTSLFGNHDDASFVWPLDWFSSSGVPPILCPSVSNSSFFGDDDDYDGCGFRGTTRVELIQEELKASSALSYSAIGPKELWPSVTNYVIPVVSSDGSKRVVALLYFLDSGGGSYPEVISNAQVEWFKTKSNTLNPDLSIPELIFWHIPSKAYKKVAPRLWITRPCVGSINKERVAAQEAENGMMRVLENRSSVKAVFVGHNHGLDWCCPYKDKLWLCFARHTGYGGYGNWPRGSRILEISEVPFRIKSWIRMEDGTVHSEVNLTCDD